MKSKYELQESQYDFPYHHLVNLAKPSYVKKMVWGFEYARYLETIINIVRRNGFNSLLDVGCGDGKLIYELAKTAVNQRLVGTDLSERAVALARAFNLGNGAEFICGQLSELSAEFDVITLVETLEHVPDDEIKPLASELSRLLASDGILVVSVPTTVLPVSRKHYRHYDQQLLTGQLEEFFQPVSFSYEVKYNRLYRLLIKFYSIGCGLSSVNRLTGLISKKLLASANQKNGLHLVAVFRKK